MKALQTRRTAAKKERPATELLHDAESVRIVAFHLLPGQEVPPHRSTSSVVVQVTEGEGMFTGSDGEALLSSGDAAVFGPSELHSIRAMDRPLRFLALLTPRPS